MTLSGILGLVESKVGNLVFNLARWKELVIMLFVCVLSEKCFAMFYVFSFTPGVYVETSNRAAKI